MPPAPQAAATRQDHRKMRVPVTMQFRRYQRCRACLFKLARMREQSATHAWRHIFHHPLAQIFAITCHHRQLGRAEQYLSDL
jgi:hypothetical protein